MLNVFKSRMALRGLIRPSNPQAVKSLTTVLRIYTDISKYRIFHSCLLPLVRLSAAMFTMKTQRNVGVWGRRRGLKSKGSLEKWGGGELVRECKVADTERALSVLKGAQE